MRNPDRLVMTWYYGEKKACEYAFDVQRIEDTPGHSVFRITDEVSSSIVTMYSEHDETREI